MTPPQTSEFVDVLRLVDGCGICTDAAHAGHMFTQLFLDDEKGKEIQQISYIDQSWEMAHKFRVLLHAQYLPAASVCGYPPRGRCTGIMLWYPFSLHQ